MSRHRGQDASDHVRLSAVSITRDAGQRSRPPENPRDSPVARAVGLSGSALCFGTAGHIICDQLPRSISLVIMLASRYAERRFVSLNAAHRRSVASRPTVGSRSNDLDHEQQGW